MRPRRVICAPRACLKQQRGRRDRAARDDHQVARERVLVAAVDRGDHGLGHPPAALGLDDGVAAEDRHAPVPQLARGVARRGPQVGDRHDLDADPAQRGRGVQTAVRGGGDHGALAGADAVHRGEPPDAAGEHHAGKVVAREHERLLDRAGGEDVALGAHLMEGVLLRDRHQSVEVAERRRAFQDLDSGGPRPFGADRRSARRRTRSAAGLRARDPRRRAPRRLPARPQRSRPAAPRSRRRRPARRRGGGGIRSATRVLAVRCAACRARPHFAAPSRTAATGAVGG